MSGEGSFRFLNERKAMKRPGSFRGGIKSTVTIAVSEDGTEVHAFGNRSSFPAMEINATTGTQTFSIYRGAASGVWLGFGIFGTRTFDRQCKPDRDAYRCQ